jgi:hypothetical protein
VPLGLAVLTYYVPGVEWRPRRLTSGEAALSLLSKAVPARIRPDEALRTLARAVAEAEVLEGERGEAGEFAEMLLQQMTA